MNDFAPAALSITDAALAAVMREGERAQAKYSATTRCNDYFQDLPHEKLNAWRRESQKLFGQLPASESLHKDERAALQEELRQSLKKLAPEFYSRATTISEMLTKARYRDLAEQISHTTLSKAHMMDGPNLHDIIILPPPDGMFWWAKTEAFSNDGGLQRQFESDGLHLFGNINYGGDPLIHRNIGAIATFILDPSRLPSSANNRWRSRPWVELFGRIDGWTGFYDSIWAADDKWAKCHLFLRQTALQFLNNSSVPTILGSNTELRTLINEENKSRAVHVDLPGFVPMPLLEMALADKRQQIIVDLEVRLDIEMEGDSYIGLSPQPNPFQSVLLRHFQWPIEPI
ncbi:hypothetical protein AB4Z19_01525 [Pseudoduganella sp. RAF19]|uniref:hypothetical protein n=2 Tax=unclassified Pseudoduganella TaxID=2637179 RepID=UPI003F9B7B39